MCRDRAVRPLSDLAGFVAFENFSFPLAEHCQQRVDARPQAGDLAGIDPNGAGQLLVGQLTVLAEHQQVVERRGYQIGRRLRGAGAGRAACLGGTAGSDFGDGGTAP